MRTKLRNSFNWKTTKFSGNLGRLVRLTPRSNRSEIDGVSDPGVRSLVPILKRLTEREYTWRFQCLIVVVSSIRCFVLVSSICCAFPWQATTFLEWVESNHFRTSNSTFSCSTVWPLDIVPFDWSAWADKRREVDREKHWWNDCNYDEVNHLDTRIFLLICPWSVGLQSFLVNRSYMPKRIFVSISSCVSVVTPTCLDRINRPTWECGRDLQIPLPK